jgi:hypothetical protein
MISSRSASRLDVAAERFQVDEGIVQKVNRGKVSWLIIQGFLIPSGARNLILMIAEKDSSLRSE